MRLVGSFLTGSLLTLLSRVVSQNFFLLWKSSGMGLLFGADDEEVFWGFLYQ